MASKPPADTKLADNTPAAEAPVDTTELITVTKDGESLDVHPSCVAAHVEAGWEA